MLHDVIYLFVQNIDRAIGVAGPYAERLLWLLLALDMAFLGIMVASGKMASVEAIVERLLVMGAIVYVVGNFAKLSFMFSDSVISILGSAMPDPEQAIIASWSSSAAESAASGTFANPSLALYNDPSLILSWAQVYLIAPFDGAMKQMGYGPGGPTALDLVANPRGFLQALDVELVYGLMMLGFVVIFVILAAQMTLAIVEFHLMILFALILVPFVAWEPLRFIGARAFSAVLGQSVRLGIVTFVVTLGMNVLAELVPEVNPTPDTINLSSVLVLLATGAVLVFLAIEAPSLALSLLSGMPAFGAAGFARTVLAFAGIGTRAIQGAARGLSVGRASSGQGGSAGPGARLFRLASSSEAGSVNAVSKDSPRGKPRRASGIFRA